MRKEHKGRGGGIDHYAPCQLDEDFEGPRAIALLQAYGHSSEYTVFLPSDSGLSRVEPGRDGICHPLRVELYCYITGNGIGR